MANAKKQHGFKDSVRQDSITDGGRQHMCEQVQPSLLQSPELKLNREASLHAHPVPIIFSNHVFFTTPRDRIPFQNNLWYNAD